jgi:adenylate cyclase
MMVRRFIRHQLPFVAGVAALLVFLLLHRVVPSAWREVLRENAFDHVLQLESWVRSHSAAPPRIVVIDIDRRSIEVHGLWPWPREKIAHMIDVVAAGKPAAVAIDVLFADPDSRSPAALARRLGSVAGRPEISALADTLEDGDRALARAIGRVPTALGFVLDPQRAQGIPGVPVLTRGSPNLAGIWRANGSAGPPPALAEALSGLGALSLPGDADGTVRRVPLLVNVGDALRPGLAAEAVRLPQQAAAYLLNANGPTLTIGEHAMAIGNDAMLRLVPPVAAQSAVISASDLLAQRADAKTLMGAIVFIGGSAPELGGLRATPLDPLSPSVVIQANAAAQILGGRAPQPLFTSLSGATGAIFVLGLAAVAIGAALSPAIGAITVLAALSLTWLAACALSLSTDRLVDPITPSFGAALAFIVTSVTAFTQIRRREALVRRRFEQHLAPAVVQRIVADPDAVKLRGERREVTSLFTDIEGFTSMTHRADPEQLVALLDGYFEGIAAIVFEHGGMIEKMIGDGVHALFNAPLDLDDHPRRAVECAVAIRSWSATHRRTEAALALKLGCTRIGIETGLTVVGDVGIAAKLDYTAHGDAVNAAARLEAANKEIGSTICVGPGTAACCDPALFRPLGKINVRGRSEAMAVFEPWPDDMTLPARAAYLSASVLMSQAPEQAAAMFQHLSSQTPNDPVPQILARRLRAALA